MKHPVALWQPVFTPVMELYQAGRLYQAEQHLDELLQHKRLLQLKLELITHEDLDVIESMELDGWAYQIGAIGYNNLGFAYGEHFKQSNDTTLLQHAARCHQKALEAGTSGLQEDVDCHPMLVSALYGLGFTALLQNQQSVGQHYLEQCIATSLPANTATPTNRQQALARQQAARNLLQQLTGASAQKRSWLSRLFGH